MIYNEGKLKERLDKIKIEISPKDLRVEDVSSDRININKLLKHLNNDILSCLIRCIIFIIIELIVGYCMLCSGSTVEVFLFDFFALIFTCIILYVCIKNFRNPKKLYVTGAQYGEVINSYQEVLYSSDPDSISTETIKYYVDVEFKDSYIKNVIVWNKWGEIINKGDTVVVISTNNLNKYAVPLRNAYKNNRI